MPTVGTDNKYLSELVSGPVPFESSDHANFYTARVVVEAITGGGDLSLDPVGTPLVYDPVNTVFVPYVAQDISAVTTSSLPDESPVCILIGPQEGAGLASENIAIAEDATATVTVLFRGPMAIKDDGMAWGAITSQNQIEFRAQLEKQEVRVKAATTAVTPSFVDYS